MAHGPEHHRSQARSIEIAVQLASLVDHHERMDPDIALRMPLRLLPAADKRAQFGQHHVHDAEVERERESAGRPTCLQQELLEFAPDPLRRQIVEGDTPAQTRRVVLEAKLEARGELYGAKDAQAVVAKGIEVNGAQQAGSQIAPPVEWIRILVGQRIPGDGVDREVTRRAASSGDMNGSPSTSNALWPRPRLDSRRGRATSIAFAPFPGCATL